MIERACLLVLWAALAMTACACRTASGTHAVAPPGTAKCGNGRIESGEDCEGSNLNGGTCTSLGFQSGTLGCAASCRYDTSACMGPLTLAVDSSRTTCTAPCGVFFDATATTGLMSGDYVGANFNWDFDSTNVDPNGVHEHTIGFVAAHVFEVPGTYQVSVRVRDLAGHAGSTTIPITVGAIGGPTIYVAANGNDKNTGSTMAQPMATLAGALAHAATGVSILLRRGDTFNIGTKTITLTVTGPFLVGAYSDPSVSSSAAPILTAGISTNILIVSGSQDVQLVGLHIVSTGGATQGINVTGSTHTLLERVEVEGIGSATTNGAITFGIDGTANPVFFVDCHAHDFQGYGLYGDRTDRFAMIGTTIENFTGGEHGLRIQGGSPTNGSSGFATDTYVAENTVSVTSTDNSATQDAFTFRGDDQNIVFVGNRVNRSVGFQPQNTSVVEHVSDALVEGNAMNDSRANASFIALNITAQHVVVRNNLFVNADRAANVEGYPMLPAGFVDQIAFYNNTNYMFPAAGADNTYFVNVVLHTNTTGSLILENNILSEGMTNSMSNVLFSDHMGTEVEDHNLIFAPNVKGALANPSTGTGDIVADPQFVSTDLSSGGAFQLSDGSAAIDAGAMVPVYQDLVGLARPVGPGWDMGAFEFTPPSGSPDASATSAAEITAGFYLIARRRISDKRSASR